MASRAKTQNPLAEPFNLSRKQDETCPGAGYCCFAAMRTVGPDRDMLSARAQIKEGVSFLVGGAAGLSLGQQALL